MLRFLTLTVLLAFAVSVGAQPNYATHPVTMNALKTVDTFSTAWRTVITNALLKHKAARRPNATENLSAMPDLQGVTLDTQLAAAMRDFAVICIDKSATRLSCGSFAIRERASNVRVEPQIPSSKAKFESCNVRVYLFRYRGPQLSNLFVLLDPKCAQDVEKGLRKRYGEPHLRDDNSLVQGESVDLWFADDTILSFSRRFAPNYAVVAMERRANRPSRSSRGKSEP